MNEFLGLFGAGPEQIATLNRASPGFFYLVQEAWWDDLILHIFRMTDDDRKVLSRPVQRQARNAHRRG